jgi:hypothetical protein
MVVTDSPKRRDKRIFYPVLDLSNIVVVNSAKAIDKGVSLTFFVTAYSEKNILTNISPIRH